MVQNILHFALWVYAIELLVLTAMKSKCQSTLRNVDDAVSLGISCQPRFILYVDYTSTCTSLACSVLVDVKSMATHQGNARRSLTHYQ